MKIRKWDVPSGYWRAKGGGEIKIASMSDTHILNCLKMLKRFGGAIGTIELYEMASYPAPTADMANLAWNEEFDRIAFQSWLQFLVENGYGRIVKEFVVELYKRGYESSKFKALDDIFVDVHDELKRLLEMEFTGN